MTDAEVSQLSRGQRPGAGQGRVHRPRQLAKLNVIAKEDGGKLDLQAAGQPRMKFSYKSQAQKVTLNGQPAKAVRADKLLKIKN